MVSVFSPVQAMTPAECQRVTEVTYLGTVYGTLAALRRMRPRGHGAIVQVGSALAYRAIPLQAAYCGAKHAIQGFTESLRCELRHDGSHIRLTMVQLPALNTPQFGWAKSRLPHKAQPVPPIYQPEVAAEAILWAAYHDRRELNVGLSTSVAIQPISSCLSWRTGIWRGPATRPSRPMCLRIPTAPTTFGSRFPAITARMATSVAAPTPAARTCGRPPTAAGWRWPGSASPACSPPPSGARGDNKSSSRDRDGKHKQPGLCGFAMTPELWGRGRSALARRRVPFQPHLQPWGASKINPISAFALP
jgi:hypothetical protein